MGPALNLILAAVMLGLLFLAFQPQRGWFWRWRGRPGDLRRVQLEDALKHLYNCSESQALASVESIAGALEVTRDAAAALIDRLERKALAVAVRSGWELTSEGRRYALQIIRTHRLWEQYLAQETGVAELDWHALADRVEHELTPDEVDALSARMGDPVFDPHGDPIPSASGSVELPDGQPLNVVGAGSVVRVIHIEDEPESTYRQLCDAQLQPGMTLSVVATTPAGVQLNTGDTQCELTSMAAANVTVQPLVDVPAERVAIRRLTTLAQGQEATVADISPACRGLERRRLLDLGLVPGTLVRAEFASPAGDPVAYRVRGALIALRSQQADLIHIMTEQAGEGSHRSNRGADRKAESTG